MEYKSYIKELLTIFSSTNANNIAISSYNGTTVSDITYQKFAADVLNVAGYFQTQNMHGMHIALVSPNSYNWLVTFLAIVASDNVAVILNPSTPADWPSQIEFADINAICGDQESVENLIYNPTNCKLLTYSQMYSSHPMTLDDLSVPHPNTTSILMFTSGTTGKSKVVEFSYQNVWESINTQEAAWDTPRADRFLLSFPLFHISGIRCAMLMLHKKKTLCIGRGAKYLFEDLSILNPTRIALVPAMMESLAKILKHCKTEVEKQKIIGSNLSTISYSGAYVKPSVCKELSDLGFIVEVGYGMTETTGVGTWGIWDEAHSSSVGKAHSSLQFRIHDGEIMIKGPFIIKGYYKDPEETAKIMDNGWIHTGDMGYCDDEGYLYLTGRKKNVIILSNGENINPEEIEETLYACSDILECLVYGVPKGICADIYTKKEESVMKYVKQYNHNVPLYRQIYKVNCTTTPLEKTPSGKIKRKENKYV